MPYYIPNLVSKTSCLGNSLSTFNTSFTSLDTNLHNLSTYTYTGVNYLSTKLVSVSSTLTNSINYLSSKMVSVSGELDTTVYNTSSYLMGEMTTLSGYTTAFDLSLLTTLSSISSDNTYTGIIGNYIRQRIITTTSNGYIVNWNMYTTGPYLELDMNHNAVFANPTNMLAGQTGNVVVRIRSSGKDITSYGSNWTFSNNYSALYTNLNARNIISYYYDGDMIRAVMTNSYT